MNGTNITPQYNLSVLRLTNAPWDGKRTDKLILIVMSIIIAAAQFKVEDKTRLS